MASHSTRSSDKAQLILFFCSFLLLAEGCSTLQDLVSESIQRPQLAVTDVQVTGFNFSEIELIYEVTVDNPNALSVQMLSYDYNLNINEKTFVRGQQDRETRIEASGESVIQVPMTLNFKEVYSTVESLANSDEAAYKFASTMAFDVPGMGKTEIPVSKEGTIPIVRVPSVRIRSMQIDDVNLSSAILALNIEFDNPNGFGLNIGSFDYSLNVNGSQWADGNALENVSIAEKGVTQLEIPIRLNISEMGISVYKLLTGARNVDYKLTGNFSLGTTHPLLGETNFTINREGRLTLAGSTDQN